MLKIAIHSDYEYDKFLLQVAGKEHELTTNAGKTAVITLRELGHMEEVVIQPYLNNRKSVLRSFFGNLLSTLLLVAFSWIHYYNGGDEGETKKPEKFFNVDEGISISGEFSSECSLSLHYCLKEDHHGRTKGGWKLAKPKGITNLRTKTFLATTEDEIKAALHLYNIYSFAVYSPLVLLCAIVGFFGALSKSWGTVLVCSAVLAVFLVFVCARAGTFYKHSKELSNYLKTAQDEMDCVD